MKKGQRHGMNKQAPGRTGEKYICMHNRKFKVLITTHDIRKQVHVGHFDTLEEAVRVRDTFLSTN
jgi:hypothetical protein